MKKATIICDMQFGSTGKGLIAGYLAERDQPDVVVTAWSANAGHTYINSEGRKWVHCMLANGIVSPKLKTVLIGGGSQVSIPVLLKEIHESLDLLQGKSILIHENACIIQERHIEEENGPMTKIGSTKKGCGAAMIEKIRRNPESKIVAKDLLESGGGFGGFYEMSRHFEELGVCLKVVSNAEYLKVLHAAERVQVEGAQGFSLGLHNGFYPYVTSRECTPAQICSDCNIPLAMVEKVVGTMRTYPIRVANRYDEQGNQIGWSGPAYEGQRELTWEEMGVTPEKTTVTKLTRRIFQFSEEQTRQAMQVVMPDEIFLNFANYCGNDDELVQIVETIERYGSTVRYYGWGPSSDDVEDLENYDASEEYEKSNPTFGQYNKSLNIAQGNKHMSGNKFDQEKVDLHVLDPLFVEGTARVSQFGEQKYGKSNWKKGLTQTRIINAIRRHLAQIEKGEDIDDESGFHHAYHIAWGCQVLAYQHRNGQSHLDDRRWSEDFRFDNFHNGSRAGIGGHTVPMLQDGPLGRIHPVDGSEDGLAVSDVQPTQNEEETKDPITESQRMIAEWADAVYPDRTPEHALTKMMLHEIPELLQGGVNDPLEFADVAILLFDIAHLKGIDIGKAIADKMEINKKRIWGVDPATGLMSHLKVSKPINARCRTMPTPVLAETTEKAAFPPGYPWQPRIPEWAEKAQISSRVAIDLTGQLWDRLPNNSRCILIHKNAKNRSHLEKSYCATIKDTLTEIEYNVSWDEITPWND